MSPERTYGSRMLCSEVTGSTLSSGTNCAAIAAILSR